MHVEQTAAESCLGRGEVSVNKFSAKSSSPQTLQRHCHFLAQLLGGVSSTAEDMDLHECPHRSIKGKSKVAAQMLQLADLSRACSCLSSGCCGQSSSSTIAMMRCGLQPCCRLERDPQKGPVGSKKRWLWRLMMVSHGKSLFSFLHLTYWPLCNG